MHTSNEKEHIGTERQHLSNQCQTNDRFNQSLIQCSPNVILFLSLDHLILEFNPEAERLYGRKREDVLGKDYFEEFLSEDAREAVAADIRKVLESEPTRGFENVVNAYDGQEHMLSWYVDRVLDSDNNPIGIVMVGQDITEREKGEERLHKSEEKYRTLFEAANDAIFALQVDGNNLYFKECNSHTTEVFGCRKEDIIGKSPVDFSPSVQPDGTSSDERAAELCAAAVAGEPQYFEWKHCQLDGSEFDAEVTLNRVDIAGETCLQAIVRDISESKKAEEALREQRDRAQNYLDVAGVMFVHIDTEGKVTLINKKGCGILGYEEDEIVGKNWFDNFLPEQNREIIKEVFYKLMAGETEAVEYYENTILTKDGEERIIAWHNTILREEGKIIGILSSGEDITERKKAEEALQESENRYRSVVENDGEGIVVSQDGILKFINPHFIDITGYSEEEFKSRPFTEFIHPDDREKVMEIHTKRLKGEEVPPVYEFKAIHKQGHMMWLENNGILIEWDGRPASLNFLRDITGRKKAEEALRQSEKRLKILFESAPDAYYIHDLEGVFVDGNIAAEEMLGYQREEAIGKNFFELGMVTEADVPKVIAAIAANREGKPAGPQELLLNHKNGSRVMVETRSYPVDIAGETLILGIARDITDRKEAEEALRVERDKLQALMDGITRAGIGIDIIGADYNILFQNQTLEDRFGKLSGKPCYEHYTAQQQPCNRCSVTEAIRQNVSIETEQKGLDGRDYQIFAAPVPEVDVSVNKVIEIILDITERKQAEAERTRLIDILETTSDLVSIATPDGELTYLNRAGKRMLGWPENESCDGREIPDAHPDWAIHVVKNEGIPAAVEHGVWEGETGLLRSDGTEIPVSQVIMAHKAPNGEVEYLSTIMRDITERKQAEDVLKESEKRYRLLVESTSDSIFLLDMEGNFIDANPAACDSLGRTREELLTLSVSDIDPDWPSEKLKNFLNELVTGKPETIEMMHRRKNKTSFPVEVRLTKVDVDEKQVILALARDITQRRRIEESLRRRAETVSQEDKVHVSGIDIEWNHENGVCTFEKLPVLMMWRDTTLAALMSGVQNMVGAERFRLALQAEGRKSVEEDWRFISQFPDFNKGFEAIANIAAVAGWGNWKLIELDTENKGCVFRVWNSWEGLYQKALGVNWGSGMLAGKLAGYCSMLFKDNCWADQTAFIARGDDFDEFRVHTSERSVEKEIENLLVTDKATRADMAVALQNLRTEISMRKEVEQALGESEQHYRAIVEDQTELICRFLSDGTLTFVNETYCRYFAKSRDELIGHKFMLLIPEEDHEKVKEHFASVGPDNPVATYEHRVIMPNGEIRWQQWTNRVILDDIGKVIEFQGVGRDITKQRLAEEELKENEQRFRSLSEAAFEGIAITEKGVIVDVNDAVLRKYGYGLEELKGKQVMDLVAPEDRELVLENIRSGYEGVYELKGLRKDGSLIDLEVHGRNIDYQGRKMRLTAIRDITERKEAEERERLTTLVLKLLNQSGEKVNVIHDILLVIREFTGFDAVGIRLKKGEDFPYYKTSGFPEEFIKAENNLCACGPNGELLLDSRGEPVFECMCGNVICGRVDPSLPFFTEGGSFWTNSTTALLASTDEKLRQGRTRNRCNNSGYESVALIPLYADQETIGLLQLNDRRKDMFTLEKIRFFEEIGASIGITFKRKNAEEALRESEERLAKAFQASPNLMGIFDMDERRRLLVNDAFTRITGYSTEEVIGTNFDELNIMVEPDGIEKAIRLGKQNGILQNYEAEICTKYGEIRTLRYHGAMLDIPGKNIFVFSAEDITEQRQAEKQIKDYQKQLKSLASELSLAEERERRRIATGIHDDIAQKLAMAKFSLQTLQASVKDTNISVSLEKQCELMSQVVADARSLTFELGNPVLYQVGLEAAVESYLTERIQEELGIESKFKSEGPPSSLDEDVNVVLFQSVKELLANVVKHANASTIEVCITNNEDSIQIVVQDDGVGFNPKEIGPHTLRRGGFGLFNIRERLEYFGGNLEIESRLKRGTRVTMTIAVKADAVAE